MSTKSQNFMREPISLFWPYFSSILYRCSLSKVHRLLYVLLSASTDLVECSLNMSIAAVVYCSRYRWRSCPDMGPERSGSSTGCPGARGFINCGHVPTTQEFDRRLYGNIFHRGSYCSRIDRYLPAYSSSDIDWDGVCYRSSRICHTQRDSAP